MKRFLLVLVSFSATFAQPVPFPNSATASPAVNPVTSPVTIPPVQPVAPAVSVREPILVTSPFTNGALLPNQTTEVEVTISHQPGATFKAAWLTKLPGVGMYKVRACNISQNSGGSITGGQMLSFVDKTVGTVDEQLLTITTQTAREGSRMYKIMKVTSWVAIFGAILTGGGTVAASEAVKVILPVIAMVSERASGEFKTKGIQPGTLEFLKEVDRFGLDPGECRSGLTVGGYFKGAEKPKTEVIRVQATEPNFNVRAIGRPEMRR